MKQKSNIIIAIAIAVVILGASYYFLIRGTEYDWTSPLTVFLDFAYPFGQSIYFTLTLMAFVLTRSMLGGSMKRPMLYILAALSMQYLADYLYAFLWAAGGISDLMYLTAYFLMAYALLSVDYALIKIRHNN